ncbi:metal ABC transporter ATP-binding protein [Bartonella tamiae]|uniref:ABC transporter domain-containing protein n=1 Tax=Bartonella tamiae Th239 TaxID=1094558 RepID=J0R1A0_9HYPH|nr:metal ABC transporter ATP-binding protein [Bartonella tamiae]EJF89329.1 hypothetical protein ME5_01880 [Bartonella tamiae Th239]EJF92806.1 hypothetical protein MEG_01976 [Bartonella tamiae Th307]
MTREWLLSLKKAGLRYDGQWLVRDIDLDLYRGEIVTLIGPNGSGKSTTAKMALGIVNPTCGFLKQKLNLKVGYVPQKLTLDSSLPLTVRRLMTLTAKLDKKAVYEALKITGVAHLEKSALTDLSGGELQRVLLARAIVRKPDLLVLDEPLQGVDYQGESELYALIARLRDTLNCAILLISHDLHIVMAATDRVLCLNGHICCSGTPAEIATSDIYSHLIGDMAENSLTLYQHHHDHHHSINGEIEHYNVTLQKQNPCKQEDNNNV